MTEPIEPGGSDAAPEPAAAPTAADVPLVAQRAITAPATVDRAARTVEVVWSTGARARNFVPALGLITEELEMSPNAVRMEALRSGRAPVLDTHRRGGARDVLGRVTAARLERGRGYATLQFSTAADVEPVWQRIADGTLRAVSVGYRVHRYEPRPDPATGETVHRAVDWEPFEISVVPVPVDRDAAVRAQGEQGPRAPAIEPALPDEEPIMPETTPETPAAPAPSAPPTTHQETTVTTTPSPAPAAPPEPNRAAPVPAAPPIDLDAIRAEAERAVAERIASYEPVLAAARGLLPADTIDALRQAAMRDRVSPEVLRARLWEAFTQAQTARPTLPARPETGPGHDDPAQLLDAMAEALAARSTRATQVLRREGARWVAQATFDPLDRVRAGLLEGLLAALAGSVNTVRIWDWRREFRTGDPRVQGDVPSGPFSYSDATIFTDGTGFVVGSGNPALAAGAPRGALAIQTGGWWPNGVAVGAGDLIGLAGRLYIATETVTASGAGTATVPIAPPLREALLINQPLVLTRPTVAMRLVSDDEAANPTRPGRFTAITIRLEEAL